MTLYDFAKERVGSKVWDEEALKDLERELIE